MALLDINWNPDQRQLRLFLLGLVLLGLLMAALLLYKGTSPAVAAAIVGGALLLAVAGLVVPPLGRLVYVVWMAVALPIGWTVSHLVLVTVYYSVFTPIGLAMRLAGRDPLHRRFDRAARTYWWPYRQTEDVSRYFRQF